MGWKPQYNYICTVKSKRFFCVGSNISMNMAHTKQIICNIWKFPLLNIWRRVALTLFGVHIFLQTRSSTSSCSYSLEAVRGMVFFITNTHCLHDGVHKVSLPDWGTVQNMCVSTQFQVETINILVSSITPSLVDAIKFICWTLQEELDPFAAIETYYIACSLFIDKSYGLDCSFRPVRWLSRSQGPEKGFLKPKL